MGVMYPAARDPLVEDRTRRYRIKHDLACFDGAGSELVAVWARVIVWMTASGILVISAIIGAVSAGCVFVNAAVS